MMVIKKTVLIKIFLSLLLIFVVISNTTMVKASGGDDMISRMESDINSFKDAAHSSGQTISTGKITEDFVSLGQILTMIGMGVMVAVTTYMGIKYLTSGPEAQAKLKTQLIGVIVSGLVIFGAYFIWKVVINIASTF